MRIGVDASCWTNGRGYGRYTRELLSAMFRGAPDDQFILFVDANAAEIAEANAPNVQLRRVHLAEAPTDAAAADGHRSPLDMLRLTKAVWRERLNVFFSPSVYTFFPLPPGLAAVVVIHDAIAERFPELTLPSRRARWFWRSKVALAIWQARLVMTVSDFAARDITRILRIKTSKIRVSGEAPATAFRPTRTQSEIARAAQRHGVPPGAAWFVYVGGFNPHKHVDSIVRAHAKLVRETEGQPPHLLLVGTTDSDVFHGSLETIRSTIHDAGTGSQVHWTGFVPDDELRHLHSGCRALILPSACEGFGLPAIEAAACGAPVIATTESPLPELLAGAGLFVPPGDDDAILLAMRTMLRDETQQAAMGAVAIERAGALTWDSAARAALDALREAAA
jgi:glycosyltransferase involved in cell wall biosynthesis